MGNLTREIAINVLRDFEKALEEVAEKHGLTIEPIRVRYSEHDMRMPVKLSAIQHNEAGEQLAPGEANFRKLARAYGLEPDDFGQMVYIGEEVYKITGINTRAKKYPIMAKTKDGRSWKLPLSSVTRALNGHR